MCDCHNETLVRTYVSSRSAAAHADRVTRMLREAGRQASADAWASRHTIQMLKSRQGMEAVIPPILTVCHKVVQPILIFNGESCYLIVGFKHIIAPCF